MASQTVTIEMTVAEAKAVNNILQVTKAFQNMGKAMKGMGIDGAAGGEKANQSANAAIGTINRAMKAFLSLSMGMRAFGAVVSTVNSEIDKFKQWRAKTAESEMTYGRIKSRIAAMLPPGPLGDMSLDDIDQYIRNNRGTASLERVAMAVEASVSGGGALPVSERVRNAVEMSPYLEGYELQDVNEAGRSAMMLREAYGITPRAAAGTFVSMGGVSNIFDASEVSQNLVNPAAGLKDLGYDLQSAAEAVVTMQTFTRDVKGASARTSLLGNLTDNIMAVNRMYGLKGKDAEDFIRASGAYTHDPRAVAYNKKLLGQFSMEYGSATTAMDSGDLSPEEKTDLRARAAMMLGTVKFFTPDANSDARVQNELFADVDEQRAAVRSQLITGEVAGEFAEKRRLEASLSQSQMPYELGKAGQSLEYGLMQSQAGSVRSLADKVVEDLGAKIGDPNWFADEVEVFREKYRKTKTASAELEGLVEFANRAEARARGIQDRTLYSGSYVTVPASRQRGDEELSRDELASVSAIREFRAIIEKQLEAQRERDKAASEAPKEPIPVVITGDTRTQVPPTQPAEPNVR